MINLLKLFSTDLRLLETRGSLIIRQLCLSLNTDRIYRTFAEILEQEEDLEFASTMVQRLNVILITSQELVEFRRRLRNLDSKVRNHSLSPRQSVQRYLRMVKHCSLLFTDRGATTQWPSFLYVCSLKHTSMHPIFFQSCEFDRCNFLRAP
jgi:hypothetical protein